VGGRRADVRSAARSPSPRPLLSRAPSTLDRMASGGAATGTCPQKLDRLEVEDFASGPAPKN
jgi:hypothetical protein